MEQVFKAKLLERLEAQNFPKAKTGGFTHVFKKNRLDHFEARNPCRSLLKVDFFNIEVKEPLVCQVNILRFT